MTYCILILLVVVFRIVIFFFWFCDLWEILFMEFICKTERIV